MSNTTYATLAELKARVSLPSSYVTDDTLLQSLLNTSARLVDKETRGAREGHEAFSASASQLRYFDDDGSGFVSIDDAVTITAVTRDGEAVDADDWKAYPYQQAAAPNLPIRAILLRSAGTSPYVTANSWLNRPFSGVNAGAIGVTGTWGYCTQANRPDVIKEATLTQAAFLSQHIGNPDKYAQLATELHGLVRGLVSHLVVHHYFL